MCPALQKHSLQRPPPHISVILARLRPFLLATSGKSAAGSDFGRKPQVMQNFSFEKWSKALGCYTNGLDRQVAVGFLRSPLVFGGKVDGRRKKRSQLDGSRWFSMWVLRMKIGSLQAPMKELTQFVLVPAEDVVISLKPR